MKTFGGSMKWPFVTRKTYDDMRIPLEQVIEEYAQQGQCLYAENESLKAEVTRLWNFINKNHSNKCQPRDKNGRWKKPVISEF